MSAQSQKEADNWFFGEFCGISFNTADRRPINLDGSQMITDEGCASISDEDGNLLFYTDGKQVWNSWHVQMPNGENLYGHESSTQSAVVVRKPGSRDLYYIFTVDRQGGVFGLHYSVVDMALDMGRGDITEKNVYLNYPVTEKITAVKHKNGKAVWIISHEWRGRRFFAYLLTEAGLNMMPVISDVGSLHDGDNMNSIGYMKASPDGNFVALAIYWDGIFEILHFDDSTGILSEPITFKSSAYHSIYGVEFSPDASKVYFSVSREESAIYQVDLKAGDRDDILNSIELINKSFILYNYQGMQLAPDKKIYIAKRNQKFLSAIESPNLKGSACNFVEMAFDLNGRISRAGLPTFNQSFLEVYLAIYGATELCEGETLELSCPYYDNVEYSWFGPNGFISKSNEIKKEGLSKRDEGYYTVFVKIDNDEKRDSVFVMVHDKPVARIAQGDTAYLCRDELLVLSAETSPNLHYLWTGNIEDSLNFVTEPGLYSLIVTNEYGCSDTATIMVLQRDKPNVRIIKNGQDKLCKGEDLELKTDGIFKEYRWSNGRSTSTILVTEPGVYVVSVIDEYGCGAEDTIVIDEYDIVITRLENVEFGECLAGDSKTVEFEFVNYGEDSIYVSAIRPLLNEPEFLVKVSPSLPVWLAKGQRISITIEFEPKEIGIFLDSIEVITTFPCSIIQIFQVSGISGNDYALVWMPDTVGIVGDNDFVIPIYGQLLNDNEYELSCEIEISFDAKIFYPDISSKDLVYSDIIDGKRYVKFKAENKQLTIAEQRLFELKGTVLLSSGVHPLIVNEVDWGTPYIKWDKLNGSLSAEGICRPNLSEIQLLADNALILMPEPANEEIFIRFKNKNTAIDVINIYDIRGSLIMQKSATDIKTGDGEYYLQLKDLSAGSYIMIVISGTQSFLKKFNVIR